MNSPPTSKRSQGQVLYVLRKEPHIKQHSKAIPPIHGELDHIKIPSEALEVIPKAPYGTQLYPEIHSFSLLNQPINS